MPFGEEPHRRPFLSRDRTRTWLLESIEAARHRLGFELWAFVLMPEHVHMIVLPPDGARIGEVLRAVKEPVARQAVKWVREHCPHFLESMQDVQPSGRSCHRFWLPGPGYDRNIWSPEEVHEKINYLHHNPVRRRIVLRPEDWYWSSCRAWEEDVDKPIRIDRDSVPQLRNR